MEEELLIQEKPFYRKRFFIGTGIIGVVLLTALFIIQRAKISPLSELTPTGSVQKPKHAQPETSQSRTPPKVYFKTYQNKAGMPRVPETVNTYTFKTNYTLEKALEFGRKLGLDQYKEDGDWVVLYNVTDKDKRGLLSFHKPTGSFTFQSWGIHKPQTTSDGVLSLPNDSSEVKETAKRFLAELGIADETVSCNITYQRKEFPDVTYVECHRDWEKAGLPILNFVGVLNIPEGKPLSQVALGGVDENTPRDESIINVSGVSPSEESIRPPRRRDLDGYVRPNDFNTATVAVASDGIILSVESNLRQLTSDVTRSGSSDVVSPQQAFNQFLSHNAQISLTIPAGSGSVDWNKVYPNNKARAKKATITDYLLTYLEKPGSVAQDKLVPMYLIRGTAELESGFTVRFTETVPALKNNLSFLSPVGGVVAGESIQLGSFTPGPSEKQATIGIKTSLTPTPPPSQIPPDNLSACVDIEPYGGKGEVILNIPGLGELTVVGGIAHTYFFRSATFPVNSMVEVRDAFFKAVEEQYVINVAKWIVKQNKVSSIKTREDVYKIFAEMNGTSKPFCEALTANITFPAPIIGCSDEQKFAISDELEKMKSVADKAAQRIFDALQNNTLEDFSSKPNQFPPNTLKFFQWIFFDATKSRQYIPNKDRACYISGLSPFIYLYPPTPTKITLKLGSPVTYADPSFSTTLHTVPAGRQGAVENSGWEAVAYPDGSLKIGSTVRGVLSEHLGGGTFRSRLYYEYNKNKVSFTEPKEGFVVKFDEWEKMTRKIGKRLELNKNETEILVGEVRNALRDFGFSVTHLGGASPAGGSPSEVSFRYLKISFIDRKELDKKLPIEISPKQDHFYRIHLLLTPISQTEALRAKLLGNLRPSFDEPDQIIPLTRNGFTVIELGAAVK